MNFSATLYFLTCFFSVASSTFTKVEVQRGAEVTLNCTNSLSFFGHISWFHMSDRPNITQICSMLDSKGNVTFYSPARSDKYTMTSNGTTYFLTIKKVDSSDDGLYFCGEKMTEKTVIFTATFLKIQERLLFNFTNIAIPIMAGVIALLVVLVGGLLLKIHKLLKGRAQEDGLEQQQENAESTELTYAKINFRSKRRPSEKDLPPNVVYAATR